MGRTIPSITQVFGEEQNAFSRFRRALRRADQQALDELFASARQHLAAASYAAHALPLETFLMAMLLEEHKQVRQLQQRLEALEASTGDTGLADSPVLDAVALGNQAQGGCAFESEIQDRDD
jgi:aryl-alcohol dehydrogenase-like predicted oxidoreductase